MAGSSHSYLARDGDVLDRVVRDYYGSDAGGQVAVVLAANPGLAAIGPVLEAGVAILLPELEEAAPMESVSLWD